MGADSPRLSSAPIQAVFIGGGTPTSLSPENAGRLLSTIQRCLPLANDYELTFEGRVHDLVPEKMDVWFRNGVNRMSLGVQSFDTKVRQAVGRIDDGETVFSHLQELLSYNQCAVVIDLMYGLPYQTMDVWHKDVETLVESGIDGADLYQLNVFEHSDLNLAIQRGKLPPAAPTQVQSAMFSFGKNYLDAQGIQAPQFLPLGKEQQGAEPLQYAGPLSVRTSSPLAAGLAAMSTVFPPCSTAGFRPMKRPSMKEENR
jgi:coproporphyrinogen III oxidase-like Fe-S oxidoreductase